VEIAESTKDETRSGVCEPAATESTAKTVAVAAAETTTTEAAALRNRRHYEQANH
jgi:hypothetical protein